MSITTAPHTLRRRLMTGALAALALTGAVGLGTGSNAGADDVPIPQREYSVRFHQIKALDETGSFNTGLSDEIYAGFLTIFPGGRTEVRSSLFGDFDAGETRTVRADQNCLMPIQGIVNNGVPSLFSGFERDTWTCGPRGFNAPFELRAALFERDTDLEFPSDFDPRGPDSFPLERRGEDDDQVGETVVSFSQTGLAADLPVAGSSRDYTVDHRGSGGHYRITYRVTRTG